MLADKCDGPCTAHLGIGERVVAAHLLILIHGIVSQRGAQAVEGFHPRAAYLAIASLEFALGELLILGRRVGGYHRAVARAAHESIAQLLANLRLDEHRLTILEVGHHLDELLAALADVHIVLHLHRRGDEQVALVVEVARLAPHLGKERLLLLRIALKQCEHRVDVAVSLAPRIAHEALHLLLVGSVIAACTGHIETATGIERHG